MKRITWMVLIILVLAVQARLGRRRNRQKAAQDCERGTHNCHRNAVCLSVRRSFQCRCQPGFYGNGKICVDDDECAFENGGCVHSCQNSPGNYSCSCKNGFQLARDGHNCLDENECLDNKGGCQHQCNNTLGSYQCKCNAGYTVQSDGKSCSLGTYCQQRLGCSHYCKNLGNRIVCACREGYKLHRNGKDCKPTCQVGNGGCQHKCQDTPGGPVCSCAPKFFLNADKTTCVASCGVQNGGCERKCVDSPEGPSCLCPRGFQLHQDGRSCLDVDECASNNGHCSNKCVNTRGSYECTCPEGYKVHIDQRSCTDIDECAINKTCDHVCINTPGSFQCRCHDGYQQYGSTHCADTDECSINNGGCVHSCINMKGSFMCVCRPGYKLHSNKRDCIDASRCIQLSRQVKASMSCRKLAGREQQCTLTCINRAQFTSAAANQIMYMCGPSTNHMWTFERNNSSLPSCSENRVAPGYRRKASFLFVVDKCQFKRSAPEVLRKSLANTLNKQKRFKCRKKCQVNSIEFKCGSRRKKFTRKVQGHGKSIVTAEFELQMNSRRPSGKCDIACVAKRTKRKLKKAFKTMKRAMRKGELPIGFAGIPLNFMKKSFKPDKIVVTTCPVGTINFNQVCVACSLGTYHDKGGMTCRLCPRGTYQNEEGKTSCKECPNRKPGSGMVGASSLSDCTKLCEPGQYSRDGMKPCSLCTYGFYQPDYGRTTCIPCGGNMRTKSVGSPTFSACIMRETCKPGYKYDVSTHSCQICPKGTYQTHSGLNYCIRCPGSTTTDALGATSSSSCKNRLCGGYQGRFQGVIETPNYPGDYPIDSRCTWKIKPDKRRRILVIIPEIDLREDDKCGDVLVMRKSKSPYSLTTFETCKSRDQPIAFTARSKKLWIQFKSDSNNTARGFSIPFVTYNEEYQSLIEDIVRDGRLYNSYQHQQIFKDRKLLNALLEVIAQPYNYLKYANVSHTMFPQSFFRLLTPKVRNFFNS